MGYFSFDQYEHALRIFIDLNKLDNLGINIFLEEKNRVLARFLKTNMLSYDGPSFKFHDLLFPQKKHGIIRFHQNIYSEEDVNVNCRNYPYNGSLSFWECDQKYYYNEFKNFHKLMPFWIATNTSEITNHR